MADVNEIRALKASFLGALDTAAALEAMKSKVMGIAPDGPAADLASEDLDELARLTLAHAVSSQALRGLVETLRARRSVAGESGSVLP
ncbi:MAG: hypothetical protein ACJ731_02260 [Vicinamibacterales bacterium]